MSEASKALSWKRLFSLEKSVEFVEENQSNFNLQDGACEIHNVKDMN